MTVLFTYGSALLIGYRFKMAAAVLLASWEKRTLAGRKHHQNMQVDKRKNKTKKHTDKRVESKTEKERKTQCDVENGEKWKITVIMWKEKERRWMGRKVRKRSKRELESSANVDKIINSPRKSVFLYAISLRLPVMVKVGLISERWIFYTIRGNCFFPLIKDSVYSTEDKLMQRNKKGLQQKNHFKLEN